jgi:hypothetical protein
MPKEAEQSIAQGFHSDAFDVVLREICFAQFVDFWMREVISTYQTVINNIYLYEGDIDGQLINFWNHRIRGQFEALCISMGS